MGGGGGVSGMAVGMAAGAALLIYAGFQGTDPLSALRDVATGKPSGLADRAAMHQALYEGIDAPTGADGGGGGVAQASLANAVGPHPEFVTAAGAFVHDLYSGPRRWQRGYSDCSSFVGKALKRAGVTPPGSSTTSSYLAWRQCSRVSRGEIGAGDFLVSSGHMAIAIDNMTAIGQQNERRNVQIGPISQVMWGQAWVALRYNGPASGGKAAAT